MKIKHWQGYGCLTAKKISRKASNGIITLIIKVTGNHECGLVRNDKYDLFNWLVKRFDKTVSDYTKITNYTYHDCTEHDSDNNPVDTCTYVFTIKE